MAYEELKGDTAPFLKLYQLAKAKGMSASHVNNILEIANNDLPSIEERFKRLRNDVGILQFRKRTDERNLYQLNNQIAITTNLLNSLHVSCGRERRQIEKLSNEKTRIENLVTRFKNNNEEYLKIKQAAEEKVNNILTNGKLILKFATFSVIKSLRSNPELYNFISYSTSVETASPAYGSNYISLMSSGQQQRQQSFTDTYTALILEESEKLYNKLTTELTNKVMTATAKDIRTSSLPSSGNNNSLKPTHKNDNNKYQTEESTCR